MCRAHLHCSPFTPNLIMSINSNEPSESYYAGAAELLVGMEALLLKLNVSKPSQEIFNVIFQAANSIKGGAVSCGFNDIVEISQILEVLIDKLRKRELSPTNEMVKVLLKAGEVIAMQLAGHIGEGGVVVGEARAVCIRLERLSSFPAQRVALLPEHRGSTMEQKPNPPSPDFGLFDGPPAAPAPKQATPKKHKLTPTEVKAELAEQNVKPDLHDKDFGLF